MTVSFRAALCGFALLFMAAAQEPAPTGHYEGTIQAPDREVQFTVDLDKGPNGLTGHLSMAQGPREIPLEKIDVKGNEISFSMRLPNAPTFSGKWDKASQTISGTVSGPNGEVPFEMKRTGEAKALVTTPSSPLSPDFAGRWEGALEVGERSLRLQLNLKQGPEGKAQGTLISLDQGGHEIPITTITQSGNKLDFEIRMINGQYKGTLNEAKTEIVGEWTQGGRTLPLTFKKASESK